MTWAEAPRDDEAVLARATSTWVSLILGIVVLALVASRLASARGWPTAGGAVVIGVALLTVSFHWPQIPRWIGHGAQVAVSTLLFFVLGLVGVVVPWVVRPLTGAHSFSEPTDRSTSWYELAARPVLADRPWMVAGHWEDRTTRERWQPRVAACVVLVILAGIVWSGTRADGPAERKAYSLSQAAGVQRSGPKIPAAFADSPWYPRYQRDLDYGSVWLNAVQLIDGQRMPEFRSAYLNVHDGYRRSWAPPACSCRRLTVWVYGASTVFGLGQRDNHTIPSELAREAWKHGIALDVSNKGIPGEEHWQEANRLRWDLSRGPAPDVVVFYDGASDIVGASWINEQRLPDPAQPVQPLSEGFLSSPAVERAVVQAATGGKKQPPVPDGIYAAPQPKVAKRSPSEVGRLAASRYARSRIMSQDLAAIHHLDVRWFWQPTRFSRPPVAGEPTTDLDRQSRATADAARANIPAGVVDLSDALDGVRSPIFSDDAHHNERGARIIAAAMYRSLAADLQRLAQEPGS